MIPEKVLHEHMFACEQTYQLLLDENRLLKTTATPPGNDFLEQKRVALGQLECALAAVRAFGVPADDLTPEQRAIIQKTQQIVLKTLLLDRENEQLLRKCTAAARPNPPQVRATLDQIQRLYRKHTISPDVAA